MIVYGSEYSYFTGKFEAYLRFKEISYVRRPLGVSMYSWKLPRLLGGAQLPTVQLPDGRWMTDTTPMIAWLEEQSSPSRRRSPPTRSSASSRC